MDKKINYILIGCGVIGAIIILAGSYMLYRMNPESDVVQVENIQNTKEGNAPNEILTSSSFSAVVSKIDGDLIVVTKEDGSIENYVASDFVALYDNHIRDTMKPITLGDIKDGMPVQISRTVNTFNSSSTVTLVIN